MEKNTSGEGTMNTGTFEALRDVGFDEKQAVVLATAIPDVERPIAELRVDMDHGFAALRSDMGLLRSDMDSKLARMQARQALWLVGAVVTLLGYEPVIEFIQQRFPPL